MTSALILLVTLLCVQTITATSDHHIASLSSTPYDTAWVSRACEGTTLELWCEAGRTISLGTDMSWGRVNADTCTGVGLETSSTSCAAPSTAFAQVITNACEGKESCNLEATAAFLGTDPCPEMHKVLEVNYQCKYPTSYALICEDQTMELSCPDTNQYLKVYAGFYGRTNQSYCNADNDTMSTDCSSNPDIGQKVAAICDGKNTCVVEVSNNYLVDPCPGTTKYLSVNYVCDTCENMWSSDEQCEGWAKDGECQKNVGWMNSMCRKSCWGCEKDNVGCDNFNDLCDWWASQGECMVNPDYMLTSCAKSCRSCGPTPTFIAEEGIDYSATVCEGRWIYTNCGEDETLALRISDIFFGRNGNDTCQHESMLTLDCPTPAGTLEKAEELCNGRHSCFLGADTWQWGEPCSGTYKYLSIEHTCQKCQNLLSMAECINLKEQGQCKLNRKYMLDNCFATCTDCEYAECSNMHGVDKDCDKWAGAGECMVNGDMMKEQCKESCRGCSTDKNVNDKCINWHGTSACTGWADTGECGTNPYWMRENCPKACNMCAEGDCYNRNLNCIYWASIGECANNPDYMLQECPKVCNSCTSVPVTACHNAVESDVLCTKWATDGACSNNPAYMDVSCAKACNKC